MTSAADSANKHKPYRIVGAGWSAAIAVLLCAQKKVPVSWYRPLIDFDGLPRPFPPRSHPAWVDFTGFWGLDSHWDSFGGRVDSPWSERRLVDLSHQRWLAGRGDRFESTLTDPAWAWTEPQDRLLLAQSLMTLAAQQCVEKLDLRDPIKFVRGAIKDRDTTFAAAGAARTFYIAPATDWYWYCKQALPRAFPRSGVQDNSTWWADRSADVLFVNRPVGRTLASAMRLPGHGPLTTANTHRWGWVQERKLSCLAVLSPACQNPSEWFTQLKNSVNDLVGN